MRDLQEATERICDLKGSLVALDTLMTALLRDLSPQGRARLLVTFERHAEVARTVLLNTSTSDHTIIAFERDVRRTTALISGPGTPSSPGDVDHAQGPAAQ